MLSDAFCYFANADLSVVVVVVDVSLIVNFTGGGGHSIIFLF